jgi:hypothetical protein
LRHQISKYNKPKSCLRKNLLIEEKPINFANNKDDSDSDRDVLFRDGSTTLVIRKGLLTLKSDLDENLSHNNIFQSIYTIKDKVYSLIVDRGAARIWYS